MIESGKIESLEERRNKLTLNFARKVSKDSRFKHWFPEKQYGDINLRRELKYEEQFARTERLKKSPLFHMRRMLNQE